MAVSRSIHTVYLVGRGGGEIGMEVYCRIGTDMDKAGARGIAHCRGKRKCEQQVSAN